MADQSPDTTEDKQAGPLLKRALSIGKYSFIRGEQPPPSNPQVVLEIANGRVRYSDQVNNVTVSTPCPDFQSAWAFVGSLLQEHSSSRIIVSAEKVAPKK